MAAMTLVTFMHVIARYVFNYSFVWALELTGVMFAWLIFIPYQKVMKKVLKSFLSAYLRDIPLLFFQKVPVQIPLIWDVFIKELFIWQNN